MEILRIRKIATIFTVITVVLLCITLYKILLINSIKQPNEIFIQALVEGDIDKAKKYAEGKVLWYLNITNIPKARLEKIETSVIAHNKQWARVEVTVEIINNGISDVGWYQVELIKKKEWKVIGIKQIDCSLFGKGGKTSAQDTELIRDVFVKYLDAVKTNNYQDNIGKYLAGPARTAHEMHQNEINTPLIQQYSNIKIRPLWRDNKVAVVEFTYKVDNRDAQVIAGFYKTSQGWKMVKI